jgi:exopolysaccharide biosynthesis polyprenyl glycosylphosphotransferase
MVLTSRRWREPTNLSVVNIPAFRATPPNQSTNLDCPAVSAAGRSSPTHSIMSSTQYSGATPRSSVIPFPASIDSVSGVAIETVRRVEIAIGLLERLLDSLAVVAAVWTAHWMATWREGGNAHYSNESLLTAAALFALLMVLMLDKHGDYRPCLSLLAVRETERLLRVTIAGFLLALPILLLATKSIPRAAVALALVTVPMLLALEKWLMQSAMQTTRGWEAITRRAVILGTGAEGRSIFSALARSPKFGLDPVAFVEADVNITQRLIYEESYQRRRQASVLPGPVTPELLRRLGASVLIIAAPEISPKEAAEITSHVEAAGFSTYVIPGPSSGPGCAMEFVEMDGIFVARKATRSRRWSYEAAKRALDVAASAFSLLLLAPVLAATAAAVKLTSPGPAIFKQRRVGQDGVLFEMYKFRSMDNGTDTYAYSPTSGRDPRITAVGRFLRHTCIDELPQLVNVLRGEMSLVGPRPEMPFIVEQYEEIHRGRLVVKPGITGLWQLSGDRSSPIHHNISYDLYYVRNRNFLMDVAILLHTVVFAFRGV